MIFVTVGVQLPFDRLIRAMDRWAAAHLDVEVVAQTGPTSVLCQHMRILTQVDGEHFQRLVEEAELIVAHAGMGSILSALELGKPIIVLPRIAGLGEHRNDHQAATSRYMRNANLVRVARDEEELSSLLDQRHLIEPRTISAQASPDLIEAIRRFVRKD